MYRQFEPHQWANVVDAYWIFKNTSSNDLSLPILPDGCVDIIFPLRSQTSEPLIVGCMTRARFASISPSQEIIGIRFKAGYSKAFLKAPAYQLTDSVAPLSMFLSKPPAMPEKLFQADEPELLQLLERAVERIIRDERIDDRAQAALGLIEASKGLYPIMDVALETGMSERQLERIFKEYVGVSPKLFARIIRLRHAHTLMCEHGAGDLPQIALSAGYYDQPHFNREFKEIVGVNPLHEKMSYFYNTRSL